MSMLGNKFYITTAIDYVNGKPHIGHALEKVQADVLARYHRIKGDEVRFLTGTDEHGAKIVAAAEAAGSKPAAFVDQMSVTFRDLKEALNLSWDDFIRTSDRDRHWPGAQKIWTLLQKAGDLYKKNYRGLYCVGHEAFVTEKDLVDGRCRDHQKAPEIVEEENWFFRLSKYTREIEAKIKNQELKIIPASRQNEILSLLAEGLEDVSFSRPARDLSWGIPVPDDSDHTMYVWCDALANYVSAIGYGRDQENFSKWWPAEAHVIGKDILRFHAAIWPGMLLSAGLPLPKSILVHGFVTVEGQKMSKTVGNVIDPFALVEKYGTDAVRYYLLREIPSGEDGDFSYEKFEARYNGDLANGLGNLVARVAKLGETMSPILLDPRIWEHPEARISKIVENSMEVQKFCEEAIQDFRLHEALSRVWALVGLTDSYITREEPWKLEDGDKRRVIGFACYWIDELAKLIKPFLPETAEKIRAQISIHQSEIIIKKSANLFPRFP